MSYKQFYVLSVISTTRSTFTYSTRFTKWQGAYACPAYVSIAESQCMSVLPTLCVLGEPPIPLAVIPTSSTIAKSNLFSYINAYAVPTWLLCHSYSPPECCAVIPIMAAKPTPTWIPMWCQWFVATQFLHHFTTCVLLCSFPTVPMHFAYLWVTVPTCCSLCDRTCEQHESHLLNICESKSGHLWLSNSHDCQFMSVYFSFAIFIV